MEPRVARGFGWGIIFVDVGIGAALDNDGVDADGRSPAKGANFVFVVFVGGDGDGAATAQFVAFGSRTRGIDFELICIAKRLARWVTTHKFWRDGGSCGGNHRPNQEAQRQYKNEQQRAM